MTKIPIQIRATNTVGAALTPRSDGIYLGSVVNTADPLNQSRVLLNVPQVLGTAISNWAVPLGSPAIAGSVTVGQIVYVWFTGGNRNLPVYSPAIWPNDQVAVSTPTIQFGTPVTNTNSVPVMVTVSGGTVTNITINGTATGLTSGAFTLYAGGTILVTGSGATWHWFRTI